MASRKVGLKEHGSFYSDASLEKSEDALKYLKWEITKKGVRITGCNIAFEGTMTIPSRINGIAVVEIGEGAFYHCRSIKSVEIPGSVEVVGEYAFAYCDELEEEMTCYAGPSTPDQTVDRLDALVWAMTELANYSGDCVGGFFGI